MPFVERAPDIYEEARRLAAECGGHFLDQFTYAERATDWRGNNNIAESIFSQLALERHPVPEWVVVGAGTGGTSATVGRYLRYRRLPTRLAVVDPEGSSFFPGWRDGDPGTATGRSSRIEGIGRPRVEPSFVPTIVDRMICVPDAASLAAMRELERTTGRRAGGSTGTNLWGAFQLVAEMVAAGRQGQRRHPAVRRRRAVRAHVLLRRLGGRPGPRPRPAHRHPAPVRRDGGVARPGDGRHRVSRSLQRY